MAFWLCIFLIKLIITQIVTKLSILDCIFLADIYLIQVLTGIYGPKLMAKTEIVARL